MKKYFIILLLSALCLPQVFGQKNNFSLASVPESVKTKADVIVHLEEMDYEVEALDKASLRVHRIFTVVSEEAKDALVFQNHSSKAGYLDDAEIKVYDANGKQTDRYKKKDMVSLAIGEGLIDDGYYTYYPVRASTYPVTLEVTYSIKYKSTLSMPDFRFIHPKEGIIESSYTARIPAGMNLRYKARNISIEPVISDEGKNKVYKWTVKNMAPIESEAGAVSYRTRYPHVAMVLDHFSHYGFEGDLSSWKNFGAWIDKLAEGRDVLSPERQQFFANLVKDVPDEKEKIARIYHYMQQNFRYVSIQLGIGGLQPFSADFTDKKKYGDCKALSYYMKAALKAAGIKSYTAVINAGYNEGAVDADFPSNDFNHVILCVPRAKDSIWLECTSSTAEFNELGTFTENRNALLITEEGGKLVSTPKSRASTNLVSTVTRITVDNDLSGISETIFTTRGSFRETMNDMLKDKKDEQKQAIVFYFGFKQPDLFELTPIEGDQAHAKLKMLIAKVPEFTAGEKLFLSPHLKKTWPSKLPKSTDRKLDFYFFYPFEKYDTTIYVLPAGSAMDVFPEEKELKCAYASFRSKFWYNEKENAVYSASAFVLRQNRIPANEYADVKKFFDDLMQYESQRIVVKKGPGTEKKAF